MNKIPVVCVPITKEEALLQAQDNIARINRKGVLDDLQHDFIRAVALPIPPRAKMQRLHEVADKISEAIKPFSACKSGCSFCCNIATTITQTEAEILGKAIGRKPKKMVGHVDTEASRKKWHKSPCPLLKKGRCSAYNARPLVCRLLLNIADNPYFCNTDIPPEESLVTWVNLERLHAAQAGAYHNDAWADIRDFFPPKG